MRKTKIVATVGPACQTPAALKTLLLAGANVLRINASHTTPDTLRDWILRIRRVSKAVRKPVGILVDLQGPRVRTGLLPGGGPMPLRKGTTAWIVPGAKTGGGMIIATPCREFPRMVKKGDSVLLDNGLLELKVLSLEKNGVRCRVMRGGLLGQNKGINLPHAPATLPSLTKKDLADLRVVVRHPVDYIALSFVRDPADVRALKNWLGPRRQIPVIAKVEKPSAVRWIRPILDEADGIMVARGDLGIELGAEKIPAIQKELIEEAHRAEKPVITATEMLETMIEKPRPTRAEVSDVANAVFDGTDAVMLSGETAVGKHPVQAVRMMSLIIEEAERRIKEFSVVSRLPARRMASSPVHAITGGAMKAAESLRAKAIVVFTRSGRTALLVSLLKPACPVLSMTFSESVRSRLTLLRGVIPLPMRHAASTDEMIRQANAVILQSGLLKRGDPVVVLSGKQALPGARYMAKIHLLGERLISR